MTTILRIFIQQTTSTMSSVQMKSNQNNNYITDKKRSKLTSYSYALNWSVVHLVKRDQRTLDIADSILLVVMSIVMSFMKNLLMISRVTARLTWLKGTLQDRIKSTVKHSLLINCRVTCSEATRLYRIRRVIK